MDPDVSLLPVHGIVSPGGGGASTAATWEQKTDDLGVRSVSSVPGPQVCESEYQGRAWPCPREPASLSHCQYYVSLSRRCHKEALYALTSCGTNVAFVAMETPEASGCISGFFPNQQAAGCPDRHGNPGLQRLIVVQKGARMWGKGKTENLRAESYKISGLLSSHSHTGCGWEPGPAWGCWVNP